MDFYALPYDNFGRHILSLTRYQVVLVLLVGLHLPSVKGWILLGKLNFLAKLLTSIEDIQSAWTFHTISADVYSISLVQQFNRL